MVGEGAEWIVTFRDMWGKTVRLITEDITYATAVVRLLWRDRHNKGRERLLKLEHIRPDNTTVEIDIEAFLTLDALAK